MEDIQLKLGQFSVIEKQLTFPTIRLAYAGMITEVISLVCMFGSGQGATSFNLFVRLNQPVKLGMGKFRTVKVTNIKNDGSEITLRIEE